MDVMGSSIVVTTLSGVVVLRYNEVEQKYQLETLGNGEAERRVILCLFVLFVITKNKGFYSLLEMIRLL